MALPLHEGESNETVDDRLGVAELEDERKGEKVADTNSHR